jgi:hypothetical protein
VEEVIYFTALCVTATPPPEDLSGVIGKSEAQIPSQDYILPWERRVGEFPHQPMRHGQLQLNITKSKLLSITKFISLLERSFSPTEKKNPPIFRGLLSYHYEELTGRIDVWEKIIALN